ncbi:MAG: cytochrome c peroxidase [Candidatus Methylacidiphilales bacterium]|nr:cytochrome c peroxidase [Candidatus Methylacidiphilales bacterium]
MFLSTLQLGHRHFPVLIFLLPLPLQAQNGVIDLTSLDNYANQTKPAYITKDNTSGNPITDAGATLGRVLFHDKRLSRNNTVSCSSCHQQAHAFSDNATASVGVNGTTGRHSMRLINARFGTEAKFFWNERAASLEAQTTQPIQDHTEMGFSGTSGDPAFTDLESKLSAIPEYRVLFAMTFDTPDITESRIQQSLAQFVRSIQSFDSKYDTGRAQVNGENQNFPNFTANENAGKALYLAAPGPNGAGCAGCHRPPEFDIDPNSRNNGIVASLSGGTDLTNTRSPSLRDLMAPGGSTTNGPFMHDGSLTTLAAVIAHYNAIPANNTNLDPRLQRPGGQVQNLNLTAQQRADLEAFLKTLTGSNVYTDPKWSNPFDVNGNLSLIVLPDSATSMVLNGNGTMTLTCNAAANLDYQLQSSTDLTTWTDVATITSDANGMIVRNFPTSANKMFYRFTYSVP